MTAAQQTKFWANVQKSNSCWLWTAGKDDHGYGQFNVVVDGKRRPVKAHRVAFYLVKGRWPDPCGLHACDMPACVRVGKGHVFEGTKAENTADMMAKGRGYQERPAELCERGHAMIGWNVRTTYSAKRGSSARRCRACENDAQKRRRAGR